MLANSNISLLSDLLSDELDFQAEDSGYASHNYHSFPAKFPPSLPRKFILALTEENNLVLDPMAGSGTTLVEAHINNRVGIGFDIDPIAILLSSTKTSNLEAENVLRYGNEVLDSANRYVVNGQGELTYQLLNKWDGQTQEFINYWFSETVQIELLALANEIQKIEEVGYRRFLELIFSSTIITKSGGVSLAFDLGHTRPHRAKAAVSHNGEILYGSEMLESEKTRERFLVKRLRSPLTEYKNKLLKAVNGLREKGNGGATQLSFGSAEQLPLASNSIDLVVTSPPYASNAIDYMRAHKFSLVWLGHSIKDLGAVRGDYIGGEKVQGFAFKELPKSAEVILDRLAEIDKNRSLVLRRYYSEMKIVLSEIARVLKVNSSAIVVVGNSIMKGISTQTPECLSAIGEDLGLAVAGIGVRNIDRNKRMLPAGSTGEAKSIIEQRMHEEYVIGFTKD